MELSQLELSRRISQVIVAHNPVGEGDDPATADVLDQVAMVEDALAPLGIPARSLSVDPRRALEIFSGEAFRRSGIVIFNLIESPIGLPAIQTDCAAVLELAGLPFTGSSPAAISLTTDKLATRALLASEGITVAPGGRLDPDIAPGGRLDPDRTGPGVLERVPPPWILKPAYEDASVGLEGDPVCHTREAALERAAVLTRRFPGQPVLAESFLPGRELNVSLLADGSGGVEILPVAEIRFEGFPEGMSPVVGYEAKWETGSFADLHTVRVFPSDSEEGHDAELLAKVREIARETWRLCGLAGYARVDLRLNENGEPCVLEANANPCLSPGAGFMAAAGRAGLSPSDVVRRILIAALGRSDP